MSSRGYSSSQMLAMVPSTRKTLRVLERRGLIRPVRTTGHRRYSRECLRRLWLLVTLRGLGFSNAQLAAVFDAPDRATSGGAAAVSLHGAIDRIIDRLDGKVRDLQIAREALVTARRTMSSCRDCDRPVAACRECAATGRLDSVSAVMLAKLGNLGPEPVAAPPPDDPVGCGVE
jgi:DNA-binding transcriptional MerR regulator